MASLRTKRRASDVSLRGEAHYRDMMLQLQSEFTRVVAAQETRAASLSDHNEELSSEVVALRSELSACKAREHEQSEKVHQAQECEAMVREESASKLEIAAGNERELKALCEQLTLELQSQQKQWDLEREAHKSELERACRQVGDVTAQLGQEQQRNAHMSQEIQLLQCRVDAAVKTSRSFEARLQQLKQLKKDEKSDFEAHVAHLKTRLEEKKEQNRYLAEALMDKEARRAARKEREQQRSSDALFASSIDSSKHQLNSDETDRTRRREPTKDKLSTRYHLPGLDEKRHHVKYQGSPLSSLLEDLHSHAPTSPTSSASPALSPRSTATTPRTTSAARTTPSSTSKRTSSTSSPTSQPTATRTTSKPIARAVGSERLQRELDALRRKFDACMHVNPTESVSPH